MEDNIFTSQDVEDAMSEMVESILPIHPKLEGEISVIVYQVEKLPGYTEHKALKVLKASLGVIDEEVCLFVDVEKLKEEK